MNFKVQHPRLTINIVFQLLKLVVITNLKFGTLWPMFMLIFMYNLDYFLFNCAKFVLKMLEFCEFENKIWLITLKVIGLLNLMANKA